MSPSTWRMLGLSVAMVYTGFGVYGLALPLKSAQVFVGPKPRLIEKSSASQTQPHRDAIDVAETIMPALGARDLSIGLTLFAFSYMHQPRAFGTLVLGGLVLCIEDVYLQFARGNTAAGAFFAAGTSIWAGIGWGMATGKAD